MAYFEWADDLVIDHGPIDADHLLLVGLVNELHTATSEGRGMEIVGKILDQLIDYTVDHLQREEAHMAAVNFPDLERHKIGHQKFIADLRALQKRYEDGSISVASQLSTVLRDWLSLHIRRGDKEILNFLKKTAAQNKVKPQR